LRDTPPELRLRKQPVNVDGQNGRHDLACGNLKFCCFDVLLRTSGPREDRYNQAGKQT
jgi:hypothetical protein